MSHLFPVSPSLIKLRTMGGSGGRFQEVAENTHNKESACNLGKEERTVGYCVRVLNGKQ